MKYVNMIMKSIDYIEENLMHELKVQYLCKIAGYSEYHFHRIFKATVGFTVSEYIRKRRLTKASQLLLETRLSIFNVAINCGYNSTENFARSFKKEHGITPLEHRNLRNSLHLHNAFKMNLEITLDIQPELIYFPGVTINCYVYETDIKNRHNDIPRFWNRYQKQQKSDDMINNYDYGWLETMSRDKYRYWIGSKVNISTNSLTVPEGWYLKFTTPQADAYTFVEMIHQTWDYIYQYMHDNKIIQQGSFAFERYIEASRTYSEEIYIPIEEVEDDK